MKHNEITTGARKKNLIITGDYWTTSAKAIRIVTEVIPIKLMAEVRQIVLQNGRKKRMMEIW